VHRAAVELDPAVQEAPLLVPGASPRKSRLWGLLGLMALGGISLVLIVLWQRDTTMIQRALRRAEPNRAAIEKTISDSQQLPLAPPRTAIDGSAFPDKGFTYLPAETIRFLRDYEGPVMVGFSSPYAAALKADGRVGVWCDGGKCWTRWMTHAEVFQQRKLQDTWVSRRQSELLEAPPNLP
jgi:hypothetical protein